MNSTNEYLDLKTLLYNLVDDKSKFSKMIYFLIIFNIGSMVLESHKPFRVKYYDLFRIIELISVIIFTVEYILRFLESFLRAGDANKSFIHRFKYLFSGFGIVDFLSIIPFYLPLLFTFNLLGLRLLRLLRLIRIFKLGKYSKPIRTIIGILKESKPELLVTMFIAFILLSVSSILIFYSENAVQPDEFSSILEAFWWSLGTLTTVGYEHANPITPLGKLLGGVIGAIGIGFVALPTGIISSSLIDKVRKERERKMEHSCPHCGKRH